MKALINIINSQLSPELINGVELPDNLLDARTNEEIKERYFYIYHALYGKISLSIARKTNKASLTINELGFISERLEAYLKEQGF